MVFEMYFIVCFIGKPDICKRETIALYPSPGLCVNKFRPQLTKWFEENPYWLVKEAFCKDLEDWT